MFPPTPFSPACWNPIHQSGIDCSLLAANLAPKSGWWGRRIWVRKAFGGNFSWNSQHRTNVPLRVATPAQFWLFTWKAVSLNVLPSIPHAWPELFPVRPAASGEAVGNFFDSQVSSAPARILKRAWERQASRLPWCKTVPRLGPCWGNEAGQSERTHLCIWHLVRLTGWIKMGRWNGLWKPWGAEGGCYVLEGACVLSETRPLLHLPWISSGALAMWSLHPNTFAK